MKRLQRWLEDQCDKNNLSWREASIRANLNPGAVSAIMGGQRPGLESCKALAKLFRVSPVLVLQLAGHIEEYISPDNLALTDPRFAYIASRWKFFSERIKDHLHNQIKLLEEENPEVRAAMRARGIEPPEPQKDEP